MADAKSTMKEALGAMGPVEWSDLPTESLDDFLKEIFLHAEVLANSIPLPDSDAPADFPEAKPYAKAESSADTVVEAHSTPLDVQHADIQKTWGKPINKPNPKDNPLHVWMYKTAGHDKRGAWFARRSIHKGLPFSKWKNAMSKEFATSLKVNKGPGSGAVRGIAGDKRIDKKEVDGVGNVDVWLLSSSFPGPTSPRDFVTLLCTSESGLTEASVVNGSEDKKPPRHFLVVSKPLKHPDGSERQGMVRGYYESVELAREIPGTGTDSEENLVEWIMVTRSDPGGGIPRFMVERGTPGSIVADVPKWLDWAIKKGGDLPDDDKRIEQEVQEANDAQEKSAGADGQATKATSSQRGDGTTIGADNADENQGYSSLLGNLTTAVGSTVAGYMPTFGSNGATHADDDTESSSSSSESDDGPFESADEGAEPLSHQRHKHQQSTDGTSVLSMERDADGQPIPRNKHEEKLLKLQAQRQALEEKHAGAREDESRRSKEIAERDDVETQKQQEKLDKDRLKQEEKYAKELRQLEAKRQKEERKADEAREKERKKAEERRRKAIEKDAVLKAQMERDEAKEKLKIAENENKILKEQVDELNKENTSLLQKLGGGQSPIAGAAASNTNLHSRNASCAYASSIRDGPAPIISSEQLAEKK